MALPGKGLNDIFSFKMSTQTK